MSLVKRLSVFALAVVTTLSLVGSISPVKAATYSAGDLLAVEGQADAAVYYIGSDGMKYVFPDSKTYFTWYENFDDVMRVSVADLDMYDDGGAVTYRPGTKLVTHMNTAKVYAVSPGGTLHWIASEEIASNLYGADWGSRIMDVIPGYFSSSYTTGSDLADMYPTGTLVQMGETIYYIDGTTKRAFANADAFEANNFSYDNVIDVDSLSDYTDGDSITGEELALSGYMPSEGDGDGDVTPGSLTVSTASDTPNPGVVPSTSASVEWAKFKLKAGANGATVESMTVLRSGVGPYDDFQAVYLYEGDTRLTSGKTINSSSNKVVFNSLNLELSANQTRYISVVVDAKASKTGTHMFSVDTVTLDSGTASASANGNYISFSPNNAGTVAITKGSAPSNANVGEQNAELTSFTLTTATHDGSLEDVSLYFGGAVSRGDISNLELYKNSMSAENLVASTSGLSGQDLAVFHLDTPITLDKGTGVKFYVYGDISTDAKAGSAETVIFYLDETSDIRVMDTTYDFPMGVDNGIYSWTGGTGAGTYDGSGTNFTTFYLEAADVTVNTSGPSASNVDAGSSSADDINFLNFSITNNQDIEVKNIQIEFHRVTGTDLDASDTTVTGNYITDVKITDTDTNTVVWGPTDISSFSDIGSSAGVGKSWTDAYGLDAGTHNFKVTADLKHASINEVASTQYYVVLGDKVDGNTFTATSLKNVNNNSYITSIVPSSYTQGANMTLLGPSLTVLRSTTPNSDDIVRGASGLTVANLIFSAASSGADVKVTSVKVSGYVDGWSRAVTLTKDSTSTLEITDLIMNVKAYAEQADGSETLVGAKSFNTSGEATFSSLAWSIPAGETRNLRLTVDTNSGHTPTVGLTTLDAFAVDITDFSADVSAETSSGTALTAAQMGTATYDLPNAATTANAGPKFAMYTAGTLTVQNGPSKPSVSLVTTGSSDTYYHQLEVFTAYENLAITKMKFLASGNFGNFASVKLSGKNSAGTTVSYTRSVDGTGYVTFTGMDLKADEDGEYIDVYVTLNTVNNGANVGTASTWNLQTTGFEAAGVSGSNTSITSFTDSDSASNGLYVVKSKPVFANAGANGSLADGVNTLYKFTVTPSGEDKVAIKKLKFNVDGTGSALNLTNFRLYKGSSCSTGIDTAFFTSGLYATSLGASFILNSNTAVFGADATSTVYMMFEESSDSSYTDATDADGELVVPVGGETYCLKATVAGSASNYSIVTSIAEEGQDTGTPNIGALAYDLADTDVVVQAGSTDSDIVWSDYASTTSHEDALDNSGSSADWYTGTYLPGLQSDATSLSKT